MIEAIFLCLLFQVNPYTIGQYQALDIPNIPGASSQSSVSGFPNTNGKLFGQSMVKSCINTINSAAFLYRDDIQKNAKHIQASMQASFAKGNDTFGVIIQSNSTSSVTDFFIITKQRHGYASFSTGVCSINPSWSYFVYFIEKEDNWSIQYVPQTGQGSDFNSSKIEVFDKILANSEGPKCTCQDLSVTQLYLQEVDGFYWNIVCHSAPISEAYVPMLGKQWVRLRPALCYYLLYAIVL